jgi:D-3-phosphoglycerate dehydrogenase
MGVCPRQALSWQSNNSRGRKHVYKIFVADKLSSEGVAVLRQQADAEVDFSPGLDTPEIVQHMRTADAVIVRSAVSIRGEILAAADKVRVIGRAGIGVDNIDVDGATERGIVVLNTPDANATTTAELAVAHLFSISRFLPQADRSVRAGEWERNKYVGTEIAGKTVGIVGFGTIGRIVADRCRGMKMRVIAHDPYITDERLIEHGVEPRSLDQLLAESDYVTLHCPVTETTRNLFNADRFARMKKGAFLINCARGTLVDEVALVAALDAKHLAGAALDVYANEPPKGSPVLGHERIVLTPHLGASTHEAQAAVGVEIVRQVMTFLRTGEAINAVNLPRISGESLRKLNPWQSLGRKLGGLLACMAGTPMSRIEVTLVGRASEVGVNPMATEVLVGILQRQLSVPVNQVNARHLAKRQGLALVESSSEESHDYVSLLRVTGYGENDAIAVEGTLFDDRHPRLVRINKYEIEAALLGHFIFTRHADRPGVIGAIGAAMGRRGINISSMHVGVAPGTDQALAAIGVSTVLDDASLAEIRAIQAVSKAVQISF